MWMSVNFHRLSDDIILKEKRRLFYHDTVHKKYPHYVT